MYYLLKVLVFLITLIPLKFLYWAGAAATSIVFMLWKEKRDNVYKNYNIILSKKFGRPARPEEIKNVMKQNFKNYGMFNAEFLYLNKMVKKGMVPEMRNKETINTALSKGKGLVMCTLHFSNWDIAGLAISGHYDNVCAIADDLGGGYSRFIQETRGKYGIKVILPNKNLKDAYRCLNTNGILNILVDRPVSRADKRGVEAEFFGKKTFVAGTAAAIVLKTGAEVMLGCAVRDKNKFYGNPGKIIDFKPSGNYNYDIQILTQKILNESEKLIMKFPEQWYMFRDFWKK